MIIIQDVSVRGPHQLKTVKHDTQLGLCMTCYLIKGKMGMKIKIER